MSHDKLEEEFWGDCTNTLTEELKQVRYLEAMGFIRIRNWKTAHAWDGEGKSYLDIGGGPASVLLKFENLHASMVVDPGTYPEWVMQRYDSIGIEYERTPGERFDPGERFFDIVLIYNCLQHCEDPAQVIHRAICAVGASGLRMFEWIDIPPHEGHPHMLTISKLEEWTGRRGVVREYYGADELYGKAWILGRP